MTSPGRFYEIECTDLISKGPWVDIRTFGASTSLSDNNAAITAANSFAFSNGKGLYIPPGTFKIVSNVNLSVPIKGESPTLSVIENTGTGNAITFSGLPYHSLCENFGVKGNANSQDGIVFSANTSYCQFNNVYSYSHGRHGLVHRDSWATKYAFCKFHNNGGLGIYLNSQSGDTSTANGVMFLECESRWNGGSGASVTCNDDKGGVKILGGASVAFIGGVYESNHAWAFILGGNTFAKRNVHIKNIYAEDNGTNATEGGFIYISGIWEYVSVKESWLGYGAAASCTNYCFYITRPDSNKRIFKEEDNFLTTSGAGTNTRSYGTTDEYPHIYSTDILTAGATTILTASNDSQYQIGGHIWITKANTTQAGCYPFLAQRDNGGGGRSVTVGSTIVGSVTTPPTMAWSGNDLQVTFATDHYGYVEFTEWTQGATTYNLNTALFEAKIRRK